MSAFRTSNPILNESVFRGASPFGNLERRAVRSDVMTVQGAAIAGLVLVGICLIAAVASWIYLQNSPLLFPALIGASLLGCVLTLVTSFAHKTAPFIGPLIAVCEGVFAGSASIFWSMYASRATTGTAAALGTGLVLQASLLTMGITVAMLIAYSTRLIRVTDKLRMAIVGATMGICFLSLISLVLNLFGVHIPYIWGNGPIGLAVAGFIVVVASFNLVLDFDVIESGAAAGLPRHMNWFAAIGLLVTLVWLYVSILRLLAMLNRRN